jgi:serpin B
MKKIMACVLVLAMFVSLCGCAQKKEPEVTAGPLAAVKYPETYGYDDWDSYRRIRQENPLEEDFLSALDAFSYKTAAAVLSSGEGNANFSPLSLYFALAIAGSGAGGETRAQILDLLGVDSVDTLYRECSRLYRRLYLDDGLSSLKIANSLWLGKNAVFRDAFVSNAVSNFYAPAFSIDFADPNAGKMMGSWIAENTNGTLSPKLETDPEQILAIINTVYFYSQWIDRFDASKTAPDIFHSPEGDVTVDFMNRNAGSMAFARGEGYTRSSLPLKKGSMVFILPDEGVNVASLVASPEKVREIFEGGESYNGEVVWKVPKFGFDSKYDLIDTLKALGVSDAFEPDADFSGITGGTCFISKVIQQTRIGINEEGVEASAYTYIGYAGAVKPTGRADMILDRPFVYGITSDSGELLFVGICSNFPQ